MKDPYRILGIMPSASDDEVKAAYKSLIRQYSDDHEKITEITEAYDVIMNARRGGNMQSAINGFTEVRRLLRDGNYNDAGAILDSIQERTAEWHFLNGSVCYAKGWLNEAYSSFEQACKMEPYNPEYASAFRHMQKNKGGYMQGDPNERSFGGNLGDGCTCTVCDICNGLICADCCCECMGGDCITCC